MDADTLRLILIVCSGFVLAGLYLWERRRHRAEHEEDWEDEQLDGDKREPQLGPLEGHDGTGLPDDVRGGRGGGSPDPAGGQAPAHPGDEPDQPEFHMGSTSARPEGAAQAPPPGSLILLFHVASSGEPFGGPAIVQSATQCGLEPGEMDIFHRYLDPEVPGVPLFSMANMVKPGTFPFGAMADFDSPGLTLFTQLDGAADDLARLEDMLATVHALAEHLGGEALDETRSALTVQVEDRLRDRVLELLERRLSETGKE